jgi:hypothetical protein
MNSKQRRTYRRRTQRLALKLKQLETVAQQVQIHADATVQAMQKITSHLTVLNSLKEN